MWPCSVDLDEQGLDVGLGVRRRSRRKHHVLSRSFCLMGGGDQEVDEEKEQMSMSGEMLSKGLSSSGA